MAQESREAGLGGWVVSSGGRCMRPVPSEEERKDGQKDVCVGGTEVPQEASSVQPHEEGVT